MKPLRTVRQLAAVLLLPALLASGSVAAEVLPGPVPARVMAVQDGDTLTVKVRIWLDQELETRVRIDGIDTPESRSDCAAEKAAARAARRNLEALVARSAAEVRLRDVRYDKFGGRVRARVELGDGTDVAQAQIRAGHARAYDGGKRQPWCPVAQAGPGPEVAQRP